MITRLLSSDLPRSRILTIALIVIMLGLAFAPFLFPGARAISTAGKIMVFAVLVASFDLLLGYTGIISFAHTMFFAIGSYGIAVASTRMGPGWDALTIGVGGALAVSLVLSLLIGLVSLRLKALYYAMITMAVWSAFFTLTQQVSEVTGGDDGLSFKLPDIFMPSYQLSDQPFLGVNLNGSLLTYYVVFICCIALFLLMLRIVNSPFGRVLQSIRENDFRSEAIGYRVVVFRVWSNILGALFATLAGCLYALWLRFVSPEATMGFQATLDILLISVLGGLGTLYGAIYGSTLYFIAESYLQEVFKVASHATESIPLLSAALSPDRWMLWLGILYILAVYFIPMGLVGMLRMRAAAKK